MSEQAIELPVPAAVLEYARYTAANLTPMTRHSGFADAAGTRGSGDLMDLVAKLTLADWFARNGKKCTVDLTFGSGDAHDITVITHRKNVTTWNVKTSRYAPYRDGLNLCVKWEEVKKPVTGYVQSFVHLDEKDLPAHVHYAGVCRCDRDDWQAAVNRGPVTLPNTGGHPGLMIPVSKLVPVARLLEVAARRL